MRPVPEPALDMMRHFEALHLEPYHDPAGFPTIGYGHLLSRKKWAPLDLWQPISVQEADAYLAADAITAAMSVCRLIDAELTDNQYVALVDFTFWAGGGNLQVSTLRRVINRGDLHEAPRQFMRWVYSGGVKLPGLVRRRRAEVDLWNST